MNHFQIQKIIVLFISMMMLSTSYANPLKENGQNNLNAWRIKHKIPGVALLVRSPSYHGFFMSGDTALQQGKPITPDTLFGVGSITKTFISASILKLEAENKLTIHDKLGQYLPQYPRWKNITIIQLLNMTSGIFNYMNDRNYKNDMKFLYKKLWDSNQLIDLAYHHADDFKGGHGWSYSNTGYLLLGKIIVKVTHQSVAENLAAQFFQPLNLHHTFYSETDYPPTVFNQMARGYYNGVTIKPSLSENIGAAAGGLVMNADDLYTWVNHLFIQKDVLPAQQLREMLTGVPIPPKKVKPENSQYGLGVTITNKKQSNEMIWYTGVTPTHTAIYLWVPDKKIVIVAMASFDRKGDKNYDLLFPQKSLIHYYIQLLTRFDESLNMKLV